MIRVSRGLLAMVVGMLGGCFEQPEASSDTGNECTPGAAGCPCSDGACLQGLECREIGCVDPGCVDGTLDCPCLPAGGCDGGLSCADGFCKPTDPGGSGTGSASTPGSGDDTSSPTGVSLDDGVDDGVTSGSGPMTTGPGMTSDDGPAECGMDMLCPILGDICVEGMCQPSGPYGPCVDGCGPDVCIFDMPMMADACSPACVADDCPGIPGLGATSCVAGQCFLPCEIGVPGTCPLPMQCVLGGVAGEPQVCMWPHPP
jgi:hypothetical protein